MTDVPIRVFIGTEPAQRLACEVLKFSISARCGVPVEFTEIGSIDGEAPGPELPQQTGFSFVRWRVPQLVGYVGRAIYMDADIVVTGNIEALWKEAIPEDRAVLARPTADDRYFTSVMLMDCAKLKHWDIWKLLDRVQHEPQWFYHTIMWASCKSPYRADFAALPKSWNMLDRWDAQTDALHYTDLRRQPWRYSGHPSSEIFRDELRAGIGAGAIPRELVKAEIEKGHIRGDLLMVS